MRTKDELKVFLKSAFQLYESYMAASYTHQESVEKAINDYDDLQDWLYPKTYVVGKKNKKTATTKSKFKKK